MQIVIEHAGRDHELDVEVDDPRACVADMVAALDPAAAAMDAGLALDGRFFGPDTGLDELGLVDGAVVTVTTDAPAPADEPAELYAAVVGGPVAGTLHPLGGEISVVGRDEHCELTIDDPTISARHAQISHDLDRSLVLADLGSSNGTWLEGEPIRGATPLPVGGLVRLGASQLRVGPRLVTDKPVGTTAPQGRLGGTLPFNRPPRAAAADEPPPLEAPPPPVERTVSRSLSAVAFLGPLLIGGLLVLVYGNPRFAIFMLLSPLMLVGNWLSERKRARKENRTSASEFRAAMERLRRDLERRVGEERARREELLADPVEVVRRATLPSTRLWERRPGHPDFLRLRLGIGGVPWQPPVSTGHDEPAAELRDLLAGHAVLPRAPVEVDLSEGGVVGLVGDRAMALAVARSLVCQAAVHHGPADLVGTVLTRHDRVADWDWAKWLPHARDPQGTGSWLAGDREASDSLMAAIFAAAEAGEQHASRLGRPRDHPSADSTRLVVVDDLGLLDGRRAPARRLLAGTAGPVAGIVLAETADQLPAVCTTVVELTSDLGDATMTRPQQRLRLDHLVVCGMSDGTARHCTRALARFEDPELAVVGAGLPPLVRLLPLLGMEDIQAGRLLTAWAQGLPDPGAIAPLGVGEDGPLLLDLRTDGPHALIGGTTGSGKSELLRSLVAGMAAWVDPDHLVFVLVDYKGGSAFDDCARLPHTVGLVTDLDEHLGQRALTSLEAELRHREHVLRDAGTQDLATYLEAGSPRGPMPRLIVVIDEFATLATELPDFLGALVGIAQRGRSLGVHLMLATQRPSGAVDANIKANTNLRIALRVQDAADSIDIIDRDDASVIGRGAPGRAYVRLGPGDVVPVQTPLSTARPTRRVAAGVRLAPLRFGPAPAGRDEDAVADAESPSDLARLVDAATDAFERSGLEGPRRPWLPMLDTRIELDDVLARPDAAPGVAIGVADEPAQQRQTPIRWRPEEGHLALFGMVGSGTTTTLLTVARALASRYSPEQCHLYAVDFGAGELADLTAFPHTGAVIAASQREAQFRLLRHLKAELDRRRDLTPSAAAVEPRIVVLVDGVGAFLAEHEGVEGAEIADTFRRLFSEGPTGRISFVVAADRVGALPMRLSSLVTQKLLLRLADPGDYSTIGVRPKQLPRLVPGRAVEAGSQRVVQVALPGDDLAEVARELVDRWGPGRAPTIRTLPRQLSRRELPPADLSGTPARIPIGLTDDDLEPVALELYAGEHALICGAPRSGKTSTLLALAETIRHADHGTILVAVCRERSPLYGSPLLDASGRPESIAAVLEAAPSDERPWTVLVDDASHWADEAGTLARLAGCGRAGLHVIAADRSDALRGDYGRWTRPVRRCRVGLMLQPDLSLDGDLFGVRLPRRLHVELVPGRGFLVAHGTAALVQVATPLDPATDDD